MNERRLTILRNSTQSFVYTILNKIFAQAIAFVSLLLLVRILSSNDFGLYNILYSLIAFFGIIFSFGLTNVLNRYLPEYHTLGKYDLARKLFCSAAYLRLLSNIFIILGMLVFWNKIAPLVKLQNYKNLFIVFSLIIILYQQWILIKIYLESCFLHKYSQTIYTVYLILKVIGYGLGYSSKFDIMAILLIDLVATIALVLLHYFYFYKKIPKIETGGIFPKAEIKRLFKYGLFYNFNDIGTQIIDFNIDNLFLAFFMNPVAVGVYTAFQRTVRVIGRLNPANYVADVIRPLFISLSVGSEKEQIKKMFQFLVKYSTILFFPVLSFTMIMRGALIKILFGKFSEYSAAFILLLLFEIFNQLSFPISMVAQSKERADIIFYSKGFAFYNLITDLIFIRWWGILGAVIATGTTVMLKNLFIMWRIADHISFRRVRSFYLESIVFWSLLSMIMHYSTMQLAESLKFIITVFVYFIASAIYCFLVFASDEEERIVFRVLGENKKLDFINHLLEARETLSIFKWKQKRFK